MYMLFNDSVYEWGINLIIQIQKIQSGFLDVLMEAISFLSDPVFYVLFIAVLFWCFDEKKGVRVTFLILFSASLNSSIKNLLQVPRPYVVNPAVGIGNTHGFSTPSGHSQGSAAFYPYFATILPKKKRCIITRNLLLSLGLPLIIGFSRVYLGVHYPSDVLLGWTIGFIISIGAILFFPKIEEVLSSTRFSIKILFLAIITLCLNQIGPDDTSMSGAFFGFGLGYIILSVKGGFNAKTGTFLQKVMRLLIGLIIVAIVNYGLTFLFPIEGQENYHLFRFVRYASIGFSASFLAPKVFIALKIALGKNNE